MLTASSCSDYIEINLKAYGRHALSMATLANGIKYFTSPRFDGYIAYKLYHDWAIVLGSPIVPEYQLDTALACFKAQYQKVIVCQVPLSVAMCLSKNRFSIHHLGMSYHLDLDEFKISWRCREDIKRWLSALSKIGCVTHSIDVNDKRLVRLNDKWLNEQPFKREYTFMARSFESLRVEGTLAFIVTYREQDMGFITFDPLWSEGHIVGYEIQHQRILKTALKGTGDFLLAQAIGQLKENGVKKLSLGLAPMYNRKKHHLSKSVFLDSMLTLVSAVDILYPFKGLGFHKDRWQAQQESAFLAVSHPLDITAIWALLKINRII